MFEPELENAPSTPNLYSGLSVDLSALQQAEANVPDQWQVGQSIVDLYNVEADIGQGGFGQVYKVLHTGWNISLAVKTPKVDKLTEKEVENFIREAETWVKLGLHPHIVTCFYVRKLGKSPRVFAEFVGGGSLHDWIYSKDGEIPRLYQGGQAESFRRILDIAIQFAWGLHYSHEQGLIHQDVKPGNTMMTADGTVKVTDFGLARGKPVVVSVTEALPDQTLQVDGSGSTPAYRSPEQANGSILTRRTDLYSWALSVLEMFKGGRRWDNVGVKVAYAREFYIIESEPLQENTPPLPQSVAELLWVCLREDSERRPRTMLDVANTLKAIYQQETGEVYPRPEPETGKDIADSLNNRAVSLLDLGQVEEAMHLWDKALEVNPLHPESTYNRGLILWRGCRITDDILVKDLEKVRDANFGNWNAHYLLALVHLERNNCKAAINSLNQISKDKIQESEVQEALAVAQERLANSNRLKNAFQGNPEFSVPIWEVDISSDNQFVLCVPNYLGTMYLYTNTGLLDSRVGERFKDTIGKAFILNIETGTLHRSVGNQTLHQLSLFGCLSPDDKCVLLSQDSSLCQNSNLELWDIKNNFFPLITFKNHNSDIKSESISSYIKSVSISGDGKYVISVSKENVKLWNFQTASLVDTLEIGCDSGCLSQDSRYILLGTNDHTLKLWDIEIGESVKTFEGHESCISSVALSLDNKLALSGSWDGTLKLWDIDTGRCLLTFIGHNDNVQSVCISSDSQFVLSGSSDNTIRLWNLPTGRCLHTFSGHTEVVMSVDLTSDDQLAVSGSWDGQLGVWQINGKINLLAPIRLTKIIDTKTIITINKLYEETFKQAENALSRGDTLEFAQHLRKLRNLPDHGSSQKVFQAWTILYKHFPRKTFLRGWEIANLLGSNSIVTSVYLTPDGQYALSASRDDKIRLWDLNTGKIIRVFEEHSDSVNSICLNSNGKYVLSGSDDKTLKFWSVETGECLQTFEGHTDSVTSVCITSDSQYVISGSKDWTFRLWEVSTGRCLRVHKGHKNEVYAVCLSPDDRYVVSARGQLKIWDVATGNHVATLFGHIPANVTSICISLNRKYLLSGGEDDVVRFWDLQTNHCREFRGHKNSVTAVCLSSDSRFALSGSKDRTIKLWDTETGKCVHTFEGHSETVTSIYLSSDGRLILSGSADKTLKLLVLDWELEERQPGDSDDESWVYLTTFLKKKVPYSASLAKDQNLSEEEIVLALTRKGTPKWTETDLRELFNILGCAGYGWLQPKSVLEKLEFVSQIWLEFQVLEEIEDRNHRKTIKARLRLLRLIGSFILMLILKFIFTITLPIAFGIALVFHLASPFLWKLLNLILHKIFCFVKLILKLRMEQTTFPYFCVSFFITLQNLGVLWLIFLSLPSVFVSMLLSAFVSDRLKDQDKPFFYVLSILVFSITKLFFNNLILSFWLTPFLSLAILGKIGKKY
ncbi:MULTISPECIES: serine/threonine-protein kinase [Planktothrix]|uniref:Serine/threonine protein kinase with WD40 repeats n=1 Tax=Planktothrix rubescens CCAP 1459/22 TaxID=329571 RepID=A0A6J7ZKI8_PLARU|nr:MULTISPECIES: serine/threonine-protein kinase [Planktothrix]CAC5342730.1 Serine/threonine protein kinase with WD40 repeats [Planktothrix rubescens NIVA-CYA 18]CAD5972638.1 putative WD repeat-containing protein alr3466 [Planktothrix rubescens NIVA-CYA 18]